MKKKTSDGFFRNYDGRIFRLLPINSGTNSSVCRIEAYEGQLEDSQIVFEAGDCKFNKEFVVLSKAGASKIRCPLDSFYRLTEEGVVDKKPVPPIEIKSILDYLKSIFPSDSQTGVISGNFKLLGKLVSVYMDSSPAFVKANESIVQPANSQVCLFYRGVTNCVFPEKAGIFRLDYAKEEDSFYRELLLRYPDVFSGRNSLEILTEMQHYELPTRMLDVTSNPLVALYMACNSIYAKPDEWASTDGEVIVYRAKKEDILYSDSHKAKLLSCLPLLKKTEKDQLLEFYEVGDYSAPIYADIILRLVGFVRQTDSAFENRVLPEDLFKSYFVRTPLINGRISSQQGAFILQGLDEQYIGNKMKSSRSPKEKRLIIPGKSKQNILDQLKMLGIDDSTMFPDLEHLSHLLRRTN